LCTARWCAPIGEMSSPHGKSEVPKKKERIIVVDDDEKTLKHLRRILGGDGLEVSTFKNPVRALEALRQGRFSLLISDVVMPHMDGMTLMNEAKRVSPELQVILITGYASIDSAVSATKQGAFHYLAKPFTPDDLRRRVAEALAERRLQGAAVKGRGPGPDIIGGAAGIRRVKEAIDQFAPTDCNVLITGESGTGKELVARAIHASSPRADGPFVACNCGAFTDELIANELFGHEREAFTGAASRRTGLLESANGGTLLLDEIADMPPAMQVKLLRVLQ
jgi:DNA-binding NtrC family response regulator